MSSPSSPAPARAGGTPAVVAWIVAAAVTVILNETTMVNAIPSLTRDFGVSVNVAQWVLTGFMLTMAAVIPVTGWLLQRVSTRTAFGIAMGTFCVGTVVCLLAPAFWVLLAGRVIQAVGTAIVMPLMMTTLMTVVAESERGRVMGNVTLAISVAPALGPTVSGYLLSLGSWRLIFAVMLPIAAGVTFAALRHLQNVSETRESTIDWLSVVIAAAGFGGLVYGLSDYAEGDRLRATVIVAAGLGTIAVFVARQLRLKRSGTPLLDLSVFKYPTYRLGVGVLSLGFLAMIGLIVLLPLYLQDVRGLSARDTGLLVMPGGLAMGIWGRVAGRLFDRYGGRVLLIPGSIGALVAFVVLSRVDQETSYVLVAAAQALLMVSLATIFTPAFTLTLGSLPQRLYSHGSSVLGTLQQVGGALGTAMVITIMTARARASLEAGADVEAATTDGIRLALLASVAVAALIVLIVPRLPNRAPDPDPEPKRADGPRAHA